MMYWSLGGLLVAASVLGSDLIVGFQPTGSQDLICGAKDFLCALFGDGVAVIANRGAKPVLDIGPAILRAIEVQGFAAKQGDRLGFDFAQVLRRPFGVGKGGFAGVA